MFENKFLASIPNRMKVTLIFHTRDKIDYNAWKSMLKSEHCCSEKGRKRVQERQNGKSLGIGKNFWEKSVYSAIKDCLSDKKSRAEISSKLFHGINPVSRVNLGISHATFFRKRKN